MPAGTITFRLLSAEVGHLKNVLSETRRFLKDHDDRDRAGREDPV